MIEQMTIVDENDNIIWHKDRWTLIFPQDIYRISALWVENFQWEVLIAQRAFSKKNQWWVRWPAVSGTVNKQEDYEKNIIKESMEEIWLKLENYKLWSKIFVKSENKNRRYFCQRFTTIINQDINKFVLQKEEVESIQRISKEKLTNWVKNKPEDFTSTADEYIKLFCK